MGLLIHLDYKNASGGGVPSPVDGATSKAVWPLDYWSSLFQTLARHGATVPILPPMVKGASLGADYDPFDHYDLGSKFQRGRREQRYGSIEQARRATAIAARNGMETAAHLVHHHVDGAKGQLYNYVDAAGNPTGGRFPKDPDCFWIQSKKQPQNPDTVPVPAYDGGIWSYGDEFKWLTGTYGDGLGDNGPGYVGRGLIAAAKWQMRCLGNKQIFWDDLKGTSANYIAWATNELRAAGIVDFAFGEFYDGNQYKLYAYIHNYPNVATCGLLDFNGHFLIRGYCNGPGNFDMRQFAANNLLISMDPFNTVTFDEDADTDESGPIFQRALQATAAISMLEGYPMYFGKKFFQLPGCYGLMDQTLRLMLIHSLYANGPLLWRYTDYNVAIFERPQAPGMISVLSNRSGNMSHSNDWTTVTVKTAWWPGTRVFDATGHSTEVRTIDSNGCLTFAYPPTDETGRGYAAWVQVDSLNLIKPVEMAATHHFYGAADLDTPPATQQGSEVSKWIWCDAGKEISFKKITGDSVTFGVTDAAGNIIMQPGNWSGKTKLRGKHMITSYSPTPTPYEVSVNYWATKDLTDAEMQAELN